MLGPPGKNPLWIDIQDGGSLKEALEFCRDQTLNDKRNDLVLLYDKNLPEEVVEELTQLKRPRKEGGFGWKKIVPWESFVGGECDTVIYVGTGSLEAFSRAKLKLMIITVNTANQTRDSFHNFDACLRQSVEKNLLQKKVFSDDDDDAEVVTSSKLR